jgi:NAD+ synthase
MAFHASLLDGALDAIEAFLHDHIEDAGASGAVLGLSGGVDSALVAAIAARALGPKGLATFFLSIERPPPGDLADARAVARRLKVSFEVRDLTVPYLALVEATRASDRRARGNLKARLRMAALYAEANRRGALVLGAGNKSELLTGYFTKWGDGGCDLLPIGDLYKTQVRELAAKLGVPKRIIAKPPSAGLWPGQTDEGELGIAYEELDRVLLGLELKMDDKTVARRAGVALTKVRKVRARVESSAHKRRMPLVCKLGMRTVGVDWRES